MGRLASAASEQLFSYVIEAILGLWLSAAIRQKDARLAIIDFAVRYMDKSPHENLR
jgi:hypothetical protein